ncbi:hypothetical protein LOC67_13675 [Stieleria sp. JC731]|uniref:hypothetical protein n=1 Tax=Pirellulaceae TaxID=2691357 RepID=UPI001E2CD165|nr:hypothetical protein [Stieleria sp. JC731]MCC9601602.1 hypothetical protein [Stieleria sp. JC731]
MDSSFCSVIKPLWRCGFLLFVFLFAAGKVDAGLMATLAIKNVTPSVVNGGDVVGFEVWLQDFVADAENASDIIVGIDLDFSASDSALTSNYSSMSFQLDSNLNGVIGGLAFALDDNVSDDGFVSYSADLPPFGSDTGISTLFGDVLLGQLNVIAPNVAGVYQVALNEPPTHTFGATTLLLEHVDLFGFSYLTMPGDGVLTTVAADFSVQSSSMNTVPEPATLIILFAMLIFSVCHRSPRWRTGKIDEFQFASRRFA